MTHCPKCQAKIGVGQFHDAECPTLQNLAGARIVAGSVVLSLIALTIAQFLHIWGTVLLPQSNIHRNT